MSDITMEVNTMTLEVEFGQVYDLREDERKAAYESGYTAGESEGEKAGYDKGYPAGELEGYSKGHTEGKAEGYSEGYTNGKADGYAEGEKKGYADGYEVGYAAGYQSGYAAGKTDGTAEGYASGMAYEQAVTDGVIMGTLAGDYVNPRVTEIKSSRFNGCSGLTSVEFAAVTHIAGSAFNLCSNLLTADFPVVESVDSWCFNNCVKLQVANFPALTRIEAGSFYGCRKLEAFIIRGNSVCALANTNAFGSSGIANHTGYVYVPDALVDSYKAATNWSTYAEQIRPLSELNI